MPKGGKRSGSGRKPTGAKMRSFRLTDSQYQTVREFVRALKDSLKKNEQP